MRVSCGNLILAFFVALYSRCILAAKIPVNVDDLDPLKECKRRDVKLIENNNKVYMYGGQSWVKNGSQIPFQITNHYLRIVDFTSARDLSDHSILTAKDIPGNITIFQKGAFWASSKKVYVAGGEVNDEPWLSRQGEFLPSNYSSYKGGTIFSYEFESERWSSEPALQPNSGSTVTDSFCCGSFAYNARSAKAYFFSGTNGSGARKLDPNTVPGYVGYTNEQVFGNGNLLTFDSATFKWTNVTTDKQLTTTGTEGGQFVYLPGTETSSGGVAILLGGLRRDTQQMESMRKVLIYDSGTGSWYSQATTAEGDFPAGRSSFCTVAASASDNSSHSVYMYGGESPSSRPDAYSDMWILSIPAFRWIRVNVTAQARKALSCTTLSERYMLTYGGVKAGYTNEGDSDECDQENYGLRLFDLTSLAWTSRYEPPTERPAFKVPKIVYDVIGGDAQGSATQTAPSAGFETPGLSSLFPKSTPTSTSTTPRSSSTGTNLDSRHSANIGMIVGIVIGSIVGIIIIIITVVLILRKRKTKPAPYAHDSQYVQPYIPHEADGQDRQIIELPGSKQNMDHHTYELYGGPPQELYAGHASPSPHNLIPVKN